MCFVCMGMGLCMPWCMCGGQRRTASATRALDQVVRPGASVLSGLQSLSRSFHGDIIFVPLCLGFGRTMKKSTMKLQEQLELIFNSLT